jgi:hypothetical protein
MTHPKNLVRRLRLVLVVISLTLCPTGCGWFRPEPVRVKANYEYFEDGRLYFPAKPAHESQQPSDSVREGEKRE